MMKLRTYFIVLLFCAAAVIASPAQNKLAFTTLASFNGTDGDRPAYMTLIQHRDGNFYGTTAGGGANSNDICDLYSPGCGTIFKITPAGALTALYSFCSLPGCADGAVPLGGLVLGSDGNFWGATAMGANPNCTRGCGTVFKITLGHTPGAMTTLHSFDGTDGAQPNAPLVQASDENFYGTAYSGGDYGAGTVFKITLRGALSTVYSFQGSPADGANPYAGLVQDPTDGSFYGTTYFGGANGAGTVFKITAEGVEHVLYSFCSEPSCADGGYPYAGLVLGTDGNFYGTTYFGGIYNSGCMYGCGTVFKITLSHTQGTLTTLHSFQGHPTEGSNPAAGLVQATDGNFYGTTAYGGGGANADWGTVFKITPAGSLTTSHTFCITGVCNEGVGPLGGLLQTSFGLLYGTTEVGGAYQGGTIYSLLP